MIRFENVTKRYDGAREALKGVSFHVSPGELAFLTGRSGAGKSTVLKLIALIEHPTRGTVTVDGRNLGKLPDRDLPAHRQQIGMVFQDNKLLGDRKITLRLSDEARALIAAEGYEPAFGARPLKRAIQRLLQNPLALALLAGKFKDGDTIVAKAAGDRISFEAA